MSANNQILVKEHKDKWYVFDNVNAESWNEKENVLYSTEAKGVFDSREKALVFAHDFENNMEWPDEAEYGVVENVLAKDGSGVTIV